MNKFEWIPFKGNEDGEWDFCPEEDQEILVSDGKSVWIDTFMYDSEGWYLDNCGTDVESLAWMSLPEPYKEVEK